MSQLEIEKYSNQSEWLENTLIDVENNLIDMEKQIDTSSFLQVPSQQERMGISPILSTPTMEIEM